MSHDTLAWLQDWFQEKSHRGSDDIAALLDSDYIQSELIDSFSIIELIAAVEAQFAIRFTPEHFQDRRFTTIAGLAALIDELVSGQT